MEDFLNVAWLVLAIVLAGTWYRKCLPVARARGDRRQVWQSFIALSCTSILLFFVISLTDDLYLTFEAIPESKSSRTVLQNAAHEARGAQQGGAAGIVDAAEPPPHAAPQLEVVGLTVQPNASAIVYALRAPSGVRGPPVLS